jgi:hypothetical protein
MAKSDVVMSLLDRTLAQQAANAQAMGAVLSLLQVRSYARAGAHDPRKDYLPSTPERFVWYARRRH